MGAPDIRLLEPKITNRIAVANRSGISNLATYIPKVRAAARDDLLLALACLQTLMSCGLTPLIALAATVALLYLTTDQDGA
jgi:hypothetical protein